MKICIVTGTRAEYGLLYWTIKKLLSDKYFMVQLCVTGMHLSPEFGLTYKQIEEDGIKIDKKIEMLLSSDSASGVSKSIGVGVLGLGVIYGTPIMVVGAAVILFAAYGWVLEPSTAEDIDFDTPSGDGHTKEIASHG